MPHSDLKFKKKYAPPQKELSPHPKQKTSTILGQEVAERVLEDVHVRVGYILGILFVLLIKKYYVLSYFILFYFVLSYFISFYFVLYYIILSYFISFHFIDFIFIWFNLIFFHFILF